MLSCGQLPDLQTCAILLEGLCSSNDLLPRAVEQLTEMEGKKWKLNIIIYTIIIEGMCKAGKLESATNLFSSLSSRGVQPDVRSYNVMINGLCDGGLLVEAEKLLREMGAMGCSPDGCTYNIIIRGFLNNDEISRGVQLIEEMMEMGFSSDASTMELVLALLSKENVHPALLPFLEVPSRG
ncbi:hypothetical protein ACLB2K_021572 [Fragaria x ananassa]